MNLFEIDDAFRKLDQLADNAMSETGGVLPPEFEQVLNELEATKESKLKNIGLLVKELEASADILKTEAKRLTDRANTKLNRVNWLKSYLSSYLNGQKWECPEVAYSFRASTSVEIADKTQLPDEYFREVITREPDKTKIAADLKNDIDVAGAILVKKQNLQIK